MRIYQNYHRHSTYTNTKISDSIVPNKDYAEQAVRYGHGIISTMEHGYQGRYIEGYNLAKKYNLKFLFGVEAYWVKDRLEKDRANCHIYIGAKNERGRRAINNVLSEANLSGFYGQARLDIPLILSLPKDDVWITTACVAYWRYEDIDDITRRFAEHFGDNFFLEVQYHDTDKQKEVNRHILELHKQLGIKLIMGCDSHYINEGDAQDRSDYILSKKISYPEEEGWYLDYPDGDTAYNRFVTQNVLSHQQIEDAISNTNIFLQVEEYNSPIFNSDIKLPTLHPNWSQDQKDEEYKRLVWQGWSEYKKQVPEEKHQLYEDEIQKEIDCVIETKMSDYFIVDYHVIKHGKELGGRLTNTGRGSAVSFITNKLLGFTEVDRIAAKVKMYPERFMSATRILKTGSLPDIDFNMANVAPFAQAQKDILGDDHAYPMIAYHTLKKSAAWKLYAKAKGLPFTIANEVSNQLKKYELAVKHADEDDKDDIDVFDYIHRDFQDIYQKSVDYIGIISSWSIAPCSYLLYQGSIREEIGLIKIKDNICCLMDGHWAEDGHFLKNDLLKVSTVDLMYRVFDEIKQKPLTVPELLSIAEDKDDPIWKVYATGCTLSVNQVEQTGSSARVAKYKPRNISELCAFIAAIRPGFKSMYKTFESRTPFSYGVKAFDDLIVTDEMPDSFVLYQEMLMTVLNYAGIEMSECYAAIKNIAKKREEKVLAYKDTFIKGFTKAMIDYEGKTIEEAEELSQKLWTIIDDSSQYSFNSSHSYCVSIDSLYCAYLKSHYPLEFYKVALQIQEEKGDKDKMNALKAEAERYFSVKFLPLRFGQDNRDLKIDRESNSFTNSLTSMKGFGKTVGRHIYDCSKLNHTRFSDVLKYLDERGIKAAKIEPLIKIDYFSRFGNEPTLFSILNMFDFLNQGKIKQLSKAKLEDMQSIVSIVEQFATDKNPKGETLSTYKINDMQGLIYALEDMCLAANHRDLPYRVKAENQRELLGYVDLYTGNEEDRRKLFVLDVYSLPDKFKGGIWKYKIKTKSIGSGKVSELDVSPSKYDKQPINPGDIVVNPSVYKDKKGYWQLSDYEIMI